MRFLFVHQNFPGQFQYVAKSLADLPEHLVIGIADETNQINRPPLHSRIRVETYRTNWRGSKDTHPYIHSFEHQIRRGQCVAKLALKLKKRGFLPDVVVAHPAWGEALFLRDIFPDAKHVYYFEYFYRAFGGDVNFDPEFPMDLDAQLGIRVKNATQLLALEAADLGISPTNWQKSRYPAEFQDKIKVIHEGINTAIIKPDVKAKLTFNGLQLTASDEVLTYVARNLEPYRGIHTFLRALPEILRQRPNLHVLIVGGDGVSYGKPLPAGETYKSRYSAEVSARIDWSRVHFLGKLAYAQYLKVLQVSSVHVYLTYPFVLSWSMLEAMASGCVLVASATAPVHEVVVDNVNGVLVDFFDYEHLAHTVLEALDFRFQEKHISMRFQARQTIVDRFDLDSICLPKWRDFIFQMS